jgi:hypothetical protein
MEPASNECPLQPIGTGSDGSYSAAFVTASGVSNLSLAFADHIANVTLNGQALAATATDEGTVVLIPNEVWVIGENLLIVRSEFRIGDPQARPLAWIRGRFAVRSSAPFVAGSNDTVATAGPFVLGPPPIGVPTDLTVAGYPFVRSPIRARGTLDLVAATSILKFNESAAAAVRIEIDGTDCGFAWAPDWSLKMATPLSAGKHVLEVTVFPSTYNVFGPQHHVDGDVHVVSPAQFEGTKNFADRPLAPPQTRVSAWHVKPLKLPSSIVSCDARAREP